MDLTTTRVLGLIGEFASFRGLKFKTAARILLAVLGRVRARTDKQLRVASTTRASLEQTVITSVRDNLQPISSQSSPIVGLQPAQHSV